MEREELTKELISAFENFRRELIAYESQDPIPDSTKVGRTWITLLDLFDSEGTTVVRPIFEQLYPNYADPEAPEFDAHLRLLSQKELVDRLRNERTG